MATGILFVCANRLRRMHDDFVVPNGAAGAVRNLDNQLLWPILRFAQNDKQSPIPRSARNDNSLSANQPDSIRMFHCFSTVFEVTHGNPGCLHFCDSLLNNFFILVEHIA
jgi:hypothetical protein